MQVTKLPRANTKQRKLLEFVGARHVTFTEIQRFCVEFNGLDYDIMQQEYVWSNRHDCSKLVMRRRYRGYNCTALSRIILPTYFVRVGKKWKLNPAVLAELDGTAQQQREKQLAVVSREELDRRFYAAQALFMQTQNTIEAAKAQMKLAETELQQYRMEIDRRENQK